MSTQVPFDRQIHRRISKACEPCRRRKTKCDGAQPICNHCSKLADPGTCHYRIKPRNRPSRKETTLRESSLDSDRELSMYQPHDHANQPAAEQDYNLNLNSQEQVSNNVTQRGASSVQSPSHLYYGPSSNFAFLQHIYQTFKDPNAEDPSVRHNQQGGQDRYKQQERYLAIEHFTRENIEGGNTGFLFLPEQLAKDFLHNFCESTHTLFPFVDVQELQHALDILYSSNPAPSLDKADTAIMLLALAHGASMTKHSIWVENLVQRAQAEVPLLDHIITLKSVQISLLLGIVQAICGRANSAYLYLGSAGRKAFALGLHKDVDYQVHHLDKAERSELRRLVFWTLAVFERWFSFWLGRPIAIRGSGISVPLPESSPIIRVLAELSDIIIDATQRLYHDSRIPPEKLWESAQHIRMKLYTFQKKSESLLGYSLDGSSQSPVEPVHQLFVMNFYQHTWILTFRPFLITHMSWLQAHMPPPTERTQREVDLPIDMWWVPEACVIAVDHARILVKFFAMNFERSRIVQGLVFSAVFLDTACCLLFYDSVREPKSIDINKASIHESLKCLRGMERTGPVPGTISTLEQMLSELDQVKRTGRPILLRGSSRNAPTVSSNIPDVQRNWQPEDLPVNLPLVNPIRSQECLLTGDLQQDGGVFDQGWPYTEWFTSAEHDRGMFAPNLGDFFSHDASGVATN